MTTLHKTICASLAIAFAASAAPIFANDSERDVALQINKGNGLLRSGDTDKAIGEYQQAQSVEPERADLSYNLAVAQYRKGNVSAAKQLFQSTSAGENDELAAKARYNLGNCDYASALQLAKTDRPAAIKGLESAISNYRSSLEVDPSDSDARANIELATNLIQKLREEEKQSQQQQKDQQQKDQQQKDQQQKDQQQKDQQQKDQQQKDQQQKDQQQSGGNGEGKDKQPPQDKQEQQNDKQSKSEETSKSESKPQPQNHKDAAKQDQKNDSEEKNSQQKDKAGNESAGEPKKEESKPNQAQPQSTRQQQSSKKPEQTPAPQAGESSDKSDKEPPKGTLTTAGKDGEKPNYQDKLQAAEFDPSKDGEMTKQEAQKMLQAIRDREMVRRMQRQAAERNQHVPVDRDW